MVNWWGGDAILRAMDVAAIGSGSLTSKSATVE
jgi:hypothetical protein